MPKYRYRATFADGEVMKRGSNREYAVAWRLRFDYDGRPNKIGGFAGTIELGHKALAAEQSRIERHGDDDYSNFRGELATAVKS